MEILDIAVVTLPHFAGLELPSYATDQASGMDLRAALQAPITLESLDRALIPTGIKIALPAGFEAQVRPRSGLAIKHGIGLVNSPGTIDADYRGEIAIPLVNLSRDAFVIERGMRVAQLVIASVSQGRWRPSERLPASDRGEGGFGHTGHH